MHTELSQLSGKYLRTDRFRTLNVATFSSVSDGQWACVRDDPAFHDCGPSLLAAGHNRVWGLRAATPQLILISVHSYDA